MRSRGTAERELEVGQLAGDEVAGLDDEAAELGCGFGRREMDETLEPVGEPRRRVLELRDERAERFSSKRAK